MKRFQSAQSLAAHAKVNLSLEVHGRRDDGFHEVSTRIAKISLADEVQFLTSDTGAFEFTCSDPNLPDDDSNLVVRAAHAFRDHTGEHLPIRIHLVKNIPSGAGLGGGSSDAATTIVGLNDLFETELGDEELQRIAATLGSDVPFFLDGAVADCVGRGESVHPVHYPHELPIILMKPAFEVPTPWAYGRWADSRPVPGFVYVPQITPWGTFENHLERPVFEKFLILGEMKRWFLGQPEVHAALMSGSGATVFAVLRDPFSAQAVEERAREVFGESTWTFVGHSYPSYPLSQSFEGSGFRHS